MFFTFGTQIFGELPILCIAGFKDRENWIGKFVLDRKYVSIRKFLKPISKISPPDFRT